VRDKSDLYYECHVTLKKFSNPELHSVLHGLAEVSGWRVATFEMGKDGQEADPFVSCRAQSYAEIVLKCATFVTQASRWFTVKRYKIEDTLLDSKHQPDPLGLLGVS
jgi:hypothetical protein